MARVLLIFMALTRGRDASGAELFPVPVNIHVWKKIGDIP